MSNNAQQESGHLTATAKPATGQELTIETLAVEQRAALDLLLMGKSVIESAKSAGVARATVYRWIKNDPVFRAAYNEWHDQLRESSRSRLLALTDKAADAVEKALEAGDARTALQLLKGMGMLREVSPGPTDPAEVKRTLDLQKKRRKTLLEREEREASSDEMMSILGI